MYLGFFFFHWSEGEVKQVWQSEPFDIPNCPFCNQASSIIYKIYNSNTKHYSAFSLGSGNFNATFTCRNCTTEGKLHKDEERRVIRDYHLRTSYLEIIELYNTNPEKATKKLEKLIKKYKGPDLDLTELENLRGKWNQQ